jgi:hypothetical protein
VWFLLGNGYAWRASLVVGGFRSGKGRSVVFSGGGGGGAGYVWEACLDV